MQTATRCGSCGLRFFPTDATAACPRCGRARGPDEARTSAVSELPPQDAHAPLYAVLFVALPIVALVCGVATDRPGGFHVIAPWLLLVLACLVGGVVGWLAGGRAAEALARTIAEVDELQLPVMMRGLAPMLTMWLLKRSRTARLVFLVAWFGLAGASIAHSSLRWIDAKMGYLQAVRGAKRPPADVQRERLRATQSEGER